MYICTVCVYVYYICCIVYIYYILYIHILYILNIQSHNHLKALNFSPLLESDMIIFLGYYPSLDFTFPLSLIHLIQFFLSSHLFYNPCLLSLTQPIPSLNQSYLLFSVFLILILCTFRDTYVQ